MRFKQLMCLAVIAMAVVGCVRRPLSLVAKEIQARGYRVRESSAPPPTDWERSRFRMRSKVVVSFKAEQPLPNERENYYCRFSLAEETYDSNDDARQRLDH